MPSPRPILLHCCCGPCSTACIERLLAEGRSCRLFFSNSNLDTEEEFTLRLENLRKVAACYSLGEVQVDAYRHGDWLSHVSKAPGFELCREGGARCARCFDWSLARAAQFASSLGLTFTTSLTVSPHKNSQLLLATGKTHPNFEPYDFKKRDGFLRSLRLSRQLGLYRQNYCGCEFSRKAPSP